MIPLSRRLQSGKAIVAINQKGSDLKQSFRATRGKMPYQREWVFTGSVLINSQAHVQEKSEGATFMTKAPPKNPISQCNRHRGEVGGTQSRAWGPLSGLFLTCKRGSRLDHLRSTF